MKFLNRYIRKISRFVLSNIFGTIIDSVILWSVSHFVFHSYVGQYIVSPVISFECAVLANFICSLHFIWSDRVKQFGNRSYIPRFLLYNLSATGSFFIKMGFLLLFERIFGWNVVMCNLAALCISGSVNFAMGEWVIFKKVKLKSQPQQS